MKGRKYADSQTIMLSEILKDSYAIQSLIKFVKKIPIDDIEKVGYLFFYLKIIQASDISLPF